MKRTRSGYYRTDLKDGSTAIAHMSGSNLPRPCAWPDFKNPRERCCRWATTLCDFPVGEGKTCDRPMCKRHATSVGPDRDYCPAHAQPAAGATS